MKTKLLTSVTLAIGFLALSGQLLAHHGTPAYSNQMTELKHATVTKFMWSNPHSLLYFDVKDEKGNVVHWVAEAGGPSAMEPLGWSKSVVGPGDVVTVYMFQAKSGNPVGRLNHLVLADGTELHDSRVGGDKHPE
jgi:hypothetical protein